MLVIKLRGEMYVKAIGLTLLAKYPVASQYLATVSWQPAQDVELAEEGFLEPATPLPTWEYGSADYDLVRLLKKEQKAFTDYFYSEGLDDCGNLDSLFRYITNTHFIKSGKPSHLGSSNDWVRGKD
jgi:hypothetical protein